MSLLRFFFLISHYGLLKTKANHLPIPIVTLGRPFHLGMLYDMRDDRIITGTTLWDPQNLANNTDTRKQPHTDFEIIAEDSLQAKAHALGVEASLKLSVLSGMVSISGSAKYANDYQKTNNETRLTLKFSTTTHFEQLTMKHLGKGNLNHPDLHDADLATHVVTGVLYGAEAFFIFDRTISSKESKEEISGQLKVVIDKMPKVGIEAEAKLNLTAQEKDFVDKFNCKFYGDFRLSQNPNTFAEAVRIYRQLPSLLGENNENAVPKKAWLYPLHLLDNKAQRIVRDISSNLIDYTINVIEKLRSFEVNALDLSKNAIFAHFKYMKKQLLDFAARLSEFQRDLKESIAFYIPKLRGNTGVEESVLFNLFKQVDSSPFNERSLDSWLLQKQKETGFITTLVENLFKDKRSNIAIQAPYEVIFDINYDYMLCLSLRLTEKHDPQLIDMHNYRYDKSNFNWSNKAENRTNWFEDYPNIVKIRRNLRQFIEFAKANNIENGKVKFIMNEDYAVDPIRSIEITLHDDESEKTDIILPSKTGVPYATLISKNAITLRWSDTGNGTKQVMNYRVVYRQWINETAVARNDSENEEEWIEAYTSTNRTEMIISNIPSGTRFMFKVQSITAIGRSPFSDLSKPISTPGNNESKTSLLLKQAPTDVSVLQTQTGNITFEISDWARYNITWLFNGNPIEPSAKYKMATKIQITLNVNTTNVSDSGTYTALIDNGMEKLVVPVNMTVRMPQRRASFNIRQNAVWVSQGLTVAGGNGRGNKANQLDITRDLYIDENKTVYIADQSNHRIMEWKAGATSGRVVAGGYGAGNEANQLTSPWDVIVDEDKDELFICSFGGNRVVRWSRKPDAKNGMTIISNIGCTSLVMTDDGFFTSSLVANMNAGELVAGGNGKGNRLDQFSLPSYLCLDENYSMYVSDHENHRVMKWDAGAKQGSVVAGGNGRGHSLTQLNGPRGVLVDKAGTVYVVDQWNHRVVRWLKGSKEGSVIAGGNGFGEKPNQLSYPVGLFFDRDDSLYVADKDNHRIQKFLTK